MEKVKKIAKYTTNILAILNALLIGLDPIWKIPYSSKISETIIVVIGVSGAYLTASKLKERK